jgi:hypothetical protein
METVLRCGYLSQVVDLPVAIAEVLFDDATQALGSAVTDAIDARVPGAASRRRAA